MGLGNASFEQWDGRSWTVLSPPPTNRLSGVKATAPTSPSDLSCSSTAFCVAVGGGVIGVTPYLQQSAVIDRWQGNAWVAPTLLMLPTPTVSTGLSDVSCVSSAFCMAVGQQGNGALAEEWNGRGWKSLPTPVVTGYPHLDAVSCTSGSFCLAVGTLDPPEANGEPVGSTSILVESWNGTSWLTVSDPHPFGQYLYLSIPALACTSPSHCLVVWSTTWPIVFHEGPTPPDAGFHAVSQLWNGSSWQVEPMPNPTQASGLFNTLYDESCSNSHDCVAVGVTLFGGLPFKVGSGADLIESWDGSRWTEDQVPTS